MPNLEPDQKKKITKNHMKNVPHRWSGSGSRDIEGQSVVTQPRRCGARPGFQRPGKRLGSRRARFYLHQLKRRDLCIGRDSGFRRYRHRILFSLPAIIAVAVVSTLQASGAFTATGFKPSTYYNLGLCFGTRTGTTAGCPDNAPCGTGEPADGSAIPPACSNYWFVSFSTDGSGNYSYAGVPGHEINSCGKFRDGNGYGSGVVIGGGMGGTDLHWSGVLTGSTWCGGEDHAELAVALTGDYNPTPTPTPTPSAETKCNDDRVGGDRPSCSSCSGGTTSGSSSYGWDGAIQRSFDAGQS